MSLIPVERNSEFLLEWLQKYWKSSKEFDPLEKNKLSSGTDYIYYIFSSYMSSKFIKSEPTI